MGLPVTILSALIVSMMNTPAISGDNLNQSNQLTEIIVSTSNRKEKSLASEPRSTDIIAKQSIQNIGAEHIAQIMQRQSGVNFGRNNGQEYLASIRSPIFTGAGACGAFLMTQDGIPLRATGFCNVNELFEGMTETAARIEVIKGPGSALHGSNALHGTINIITPSAKSGEDYLSLEVGSYVYARANASKGYESAHHGFRMTATAARDGGYRDDAGYDQQKLSIRHDYTGSDWDISSTIALSKLNQKTAGYITGLNSYRDDEIAKSNPNPEAFRKAKSLRASSQLSTDLAENIHFQISPYIRTMDMQFRMHFLPGKPLEENSQSSIGIQSGLYINEGTDVEFITGIDLEYTQGSLKQSQENPTQGSAFLQATIPAGKQYDYEVNSMMAAAYLQTTLSLTDKFMVEAGARLEHISYDYTNNMVSGRTAEDGTSCGFGGCRYSRPGDRTDDYTNFSPKVALLYSISDHHQAYANYSHGYRAPQATELYRLQRAQTVADLKSVKLESIEAGLRGHSDVLTYNVALYSMKKRDYIFRDSSFFNVSGGKSKHLGAEASLQYKVSENLSLSGSLSLAKHQYDFDYLSNNTNLNGKDIDSAPRTFGSAQIKWSPFSELETELEWISMGSYYLDPENQHKYEGHDYLNLRVSYQISENLQLYARLLNITNSRYAERADYTSFTDERYFPGKPRSFYIGIKVAL